MRWGLLKRDRRCVPLHVHIMLLFSLLLVTGGSLLGLYNYHHHTRILLDSQRQLFQEIGQSTVAQLHQLADAPTALLDTLAQLNVATEPTLEQQLKWLPLMQQALIHIEHMDAVYLADSQGNFFLVRLLRTAAQRARVSAPETATLMVQSVRQGGPEARFYFYDAKRNLLAQRLLPDFGFDPRRRDWFRQAQQARALIVTPPYLFFTTRQVGVTLARPGPGRTSVMGTDITLETLAETLKQRLPTPSSQVMLFTPDLTLFSYSNMDLLTGHLHQQNGILRLPRLDELDEPLLKAVGNYYHSHPPGTFRLHLNGEYWQGDLTRLSFGHGRTAVLAIAAPESELFLEARQLRTESLLLTISLILLSLPFAWWNARRISIPLERLMRESEAITAFDFGNDIEHRSAILEIDRLSLSISLMKQTINRFLELSVSISGEPHFEALSQRLLDETLKLTRMQLGGLWLKENDHYRLISAQGEDHRKLLPAAFTATTPATDHQLLPPLLAAVTSARSQQMRLTDINGGLSLLAVPLCSREGRLMGVLALGNPQQTALAKEVIAFIEALSGMVTISLENHQLLESQKQLMASLIKLFAGAIDAKSPYTGAHCQRVPEITKLLAEAACEAREGPYADFCLAPQQWEALHIAAWLHDCGKITTPEYVIDKSTRLETIYDRINEIRMRFEVLKRDARISYWQSRCRCGDNAQLRERLKTELATLDEEFAFVAACNQGSMEMHDDNRQHLKQIAARRWLRTLDDTLGLGHEERRRKLQYAPRSLPVWECLLADKPEQRIPREHNEQIPTDNPWGFKMIPPRCKFNLGELYNLSFANGTLTPEERYIINDHIVQTIIMLEQLPFPDYLQQVPRIAGEHHERPDGSGYPRGLTREQMPVTARMLAIADIFEALTAADRPYKRALTLTETLTIMQQMRREQHIDGELFELFLRSGAYLKYARRFLQPEQIDLEAIEPFLEQGKVKPEQVKT